MRKSLRHFRAPNVGAWIRRLTVIAFIALFAAATPNLIQPEPQAVAVPGGEPVDFSSNIASPQSNYAYAADNAGFRVSGTGTWEAWINPSSCGGSCTWVGKVNSYLFRVTSNGTHGWAMMGPSGSWSWVDSNVRARFGEWQHVAWVKNGTNLQLYVDGQFMFEQTNSANIPSTLLAGGDFSVQNRRDSLGEGFVGRVDEVRVWNTVRTGAQIQQQIHTKPSGTGLLVYYDFNDAASGTLENLAPSAPAATKLRVMGSLNATDVKTTIAPSSLNPETTYVFPRTYITREGGWRVPSGVHAVNAFVVGGGGGGGSGGNTGYAGGGGGGAQVLTQDNFTVVPGQSINVRVGVGGRGAQSSGNNINLVANAGQSTLLGTLTAIAGGAGGSEGGLNPHPATTGASGGGAPLYTSTGAAGTSGLGFAGGGGAPASGANGNWYSAGGGGGILGPGTAAVNGVGVGGRGGPGLNEAVTGEMVFYAAGGSAKGCKGEGVAVDGATSAATNAAGNTGSGGGGGGGGSGVSCAGSWGTNQWGGQGGSGVVAVSFYAQTGSTVPALNAGACTPLTYTKVISGVTYQLHEYVGGTDCVLSIPTGVGNFDIFAVGGGGGGGNNMGGGGGGAGSTQIATSRAAVGGSIRISVGAGGAGGINLNNTLRHGQDGAASVVRNSTNVSILSANLGRGGLTYGTGLTCGGTPDSRGGAAGAAGTGGSAGGAGGIGAVNGNAGDGANGYATLFTGETRFFGGGGGGSGWQGVGGRLNGLGGAGGGGAGAWGANVVGFNGLPNTGGGGGAGEGNCANGGAGGSGVVIVRYVAPSTPTALAIARPASLAVGVGASNPFRVQPLVHVVDGAGRSVSAAVAVTARVMNGSTQVATATVNAVDGVADFSGSGLFTSVNSAVSVVFESAGLQSASQGIQPMIRPLSIEIVPSAGRFSSTPGTWVDGDFFAAPGSRVAVLRMADLLAKLNAGLQVNLVAVGGNVNINENLVSSNTAGSLYLEASNDINVNRSVFVSGPTSSVVLRAARDIIVPAGTSGNYSRIHSNNGNLVLWSDSDSNTQGAIALNNYTELRSNGGDIFVAGGAATTSNGVVVPGGFASGYNGTYYTGVRLGESAIRDQIRIVSSGGDITIRGTSNQSNGLLGFPGNYVHSGTGQLTLAGNSFGSAGTTALRLNQGGGSAMGSFFISEATMSPALRLLVNNDTAANTWGLLLNEGGPLNTGTTQAAIDQNGGNGWVPSANAIATNRMLNIWGKGGIDVNVRQRTYAHGVHMGANFLAETGDITIDSGNKNIYFTNSTNPPTYLGAMPSSVVTSSSANIRLLAANTSTEEHANLLTKGQISLEPGINDDFAGDVYFPRGSTVIGNATNTPSGFRIGRAQLGTGDGLGFFGNRRIESNRSFNINGPVEFYGRDVVLYQTISASGPVTISSEISTYFYGDMRISGENNPLKIFAEDSIFTNTNNEMFTNGGDIMLGSNADGGSTGAGHGNIDLAGGTKLNTAGGSITNPSYNVGRGNIYLAGANQMQNGIPVGYAESNVGGNHGIYFAPNNATTQLVSGGGDIVLRGRGSGVSGNTGGMQLYGGLIGAGNGTVTFDAVSRNSGNIALEFAGAGGQKLRVYAAGGSNNTSSPAINVRANVLNSTTALAITSGWKSCTINDNLFEARGSGGISVVANRASGTGATVTLDGISLLSRTAPIYVGSNAGNDGVQFYEPGSSCRIGAALGAATGSSVARVGWGSATMMLGATITTSSAVVIFEADRVFADNNADQLIVQTSGDVSITPVSADFRAEPWVYAKMFGIGELTIGKDGSARSQDIRVQGELYGVGPFNIYGRMIQQWGPMRTTGLGNPITLKASREIYLYNLSPGSGIYTNNGNITLWSTAYGNNNSNGFIALYDNINLVSALPANQAMPAVNANFTLPANFRTATGGGRITLAGGASVDANGLPTGFAESRSTAEHGISVGKGGSANTIYSGGGDIRIRGGSHVVGLTGVAIFPWKDIASGQGTIDIRASVSSATRALEIGYGSAGSVRLMSSADSQPAINIEGSSPSTTDTGMLIGYHARTWDQPTWKIQIEATGAGGVNLQGSTANNSTRGSIEMSGTVLLSKTGDINIDGGTRGVGFSLWNTYVGHNIIGSCTASDIIDSGAAMCANTAVATSSANISLRGDRFSFWGTPRGVSLRTSGNVVFEPASANFQEAFNLWAQFGNQIPESIRLGKDSTNATFDTNTQGILTARKTIEIYGQNVNVSTALRVLNSQDESNLSGIKLKASRNVLVAAGDISSNRGSIVLWSNASNTDGVVRLGDGTSVCSAASFSPVASGTATVAACRTTNGGEIIIGGEGSTASATVQSGPGATVPLGFAKGFGTVNYSGHLGSGTSGNGWLPGVMLGSVTDAGAHTSIRSGGANILIRGKSTENASLVGGLNHTAYGVVAMGNSNVGSIIDASAGKVLIHGECQNPVNTVSCGGVKLGAYAQNNTNLSSANNSLADDYTVASSNTDADSIVIRGVVRGSSQQGFSAPHGTRFSNTAGGGLILQSDRINTSAWSTDFEPKIIYNVTGPIALEPVGVSFAGAERTGFAAYSTQFTATPQSFRYGKPGNNTNISLNQGTITASSTVEVYANQIDVPASSATVSASVLNPGGQILFRANSNILVASNKQLLANSSPVILWSDANAAQSGYVQVSGRIDTTFSSSPGAPVYIGGGAAQTVSFGGVQYQVPAGNAFGSGSLSGVMLESSSSLNSGLGLVRILGTSGAGSAHGVAMNSAAIRTTTGEVSISATTLTNGVAGLRIQNSSSINTDTGAIRISGVMNRAFAVHSGAEISDSTIRSTNSSIVITGAVASDQAANAGISLLNANIVANAGQIDLVSAGSRLSISGTVRVGTANSAPTSSAVIRVIANRVSAATTARFSSTNNLVLEPTAQSFEGTAPTFVWGANTMDFSAMRIGKAGSNTAQSLNQALINGSVNINGPIEVNAALLEVTGSLRSSLADAAVDLKLTTGFSSSAAVTSNNGDIRVRANTLNLGSAATINAGTGAVEIGSATSGTGIRILTNAAKLSAATTTLNISTGDLGRLTAGKLRIGASNAGNIAIEDQINRVTSGSNTIRFTTAGSVTNDVAGVVTPLNVSNLAVQAGGSIKLSSNYSGVTVSKVALSTPNRAAGNVTFTQLSADYSPETVDGVNAVFGVAASARANNVPVITATSVYQNALVSPAPSVNLVDDYAQALSARNVLADNYQIQVSASPSAQLGGTTVSNTVNGLAVFSTLRFVGEAGLYPLSFRVFSGQTMISSVLTGNYELLSSRPSNLSISWSNRVGVAGGNLQQVPQVTLIDDGGNPIGVAPYNSATVSATITGPGGEILGGAVVNATNGVASFSNLVVAGRVGVNYSIRFSVVIDGPSPATISAAINDLTLTPGAPASFRVIDQPTAIVAGVSFSPEVRLELLDAYGNRVTGNNSFGISPVFVKSDATTSTSATVTASAGVIAFNNLTFTEAGSYRIRFEDAASNLTSVTSSEFVVSPAAAHSLVWDEQPINVVARTVMTQSPRLKVIDRFGNHVISDSTTNVQLRVLPQSGNTPVSPAFATGLLKQASAGYVTFDNISLGLTASTYRLQVQAATNSGVALAGSLPAPTSGFEVLPGAPFALSIATNAATARAGAAFGTQPIINILDRDNNIVPTTSNIVMSVNQIQTTGSVSVASLNGVATFTTAGVSGARGNYLITYTLNFAGNSITTTQPIVLTSGVAAKIEIVDQPVNKKTGSSFSAVAPRIRLLDAFDNPVTISGSITARATVVSSTSTPLNTNTQSAAVSFNAEGVASFQNFDFLATPGSYRLAFSASNFAVVTSSMFVVNVSDPAILTWQTPPPATLVTGINMPTAVLELRDAFGNLIASDNTTVVTLSSANGTTLSGVTAVAQSGRFTFTNFNMIAIPGNYTLTASASVGSISISRAIAITNDVAAKLQVEVSGLQTPRAGQPLQYSAGGFFRVRVLDRFDNLVTVGSDSALRITVSATAVAVSGELGATATGGIANFSSSNIVLSGVATTTGYNLLLSSTATRGALVTGRQSVTLSAGVPVQVQITSQPPTTVQRTKAFAPGAIEVYDSWSNLVSANSNVVVQLWRESASLSQSTVAVSGPTHTFASLTYSVAPNNSSQLRFFVAGFEENAVLSRPFAVQTGDPAALRFLTQPQSSIAARAALADFSVEVLDAGGFRVNTGVSVPVELRLRNSSDNSVAGQIINATANSTTGLITFSSVAISASPSTYRINVAGTQSAAAVTATSSNNVLVANGTPETIALLSPASFTIQAGATVNNQLVVQLRDSFGNPVLSGAGSNSSVRLRILPAAVLTQSAGIFIAGVRSTELSVQAVSGTATFSNLVLGGRTGAYTLEYSIMNPARAVTQSMTITAGAASRLVMTQQPQGPFVVNEQIGRIVVGGQAGVTACPSNPTNGLSYRALDGSGDCVLEFYGSSTFTRPQGVTNASLLVVGGGGGGGGQEDGGGGGAGGVVWIPNYTLPSSQVSINVGSGGSAGFVGSVHGLSGGNSAFGDIVGLGGGGAGGYGWQNNFAQAQGYSGGSGGGHGEHGNLSAALGTQATDGITYPGAFEYGNNGGYTRGCTQAGSGGGGAGGVGGSVDANPTNAFLTSNNTNSAGCGTVVQDGGAGGPGVQISITGQAAFYAAGGAGGDRRGTAVPRASGIGGSGASENGVLATAGVGRTGSGGGGANGGTAGAGGSGIVILRFTPPAKLVPEVAVADVYGNVLTNVSRTITATIATVGQANTSGFGSGSTTQVATTAGESVFGQLFFTGNANFDHRLTFTTTDGLTPVSSNAFNLVHGEATKVEILSGYSTDAVVGATFSSPIQVRLLDAGNNITTRDSTTTLSVAVSSGSNGSVTRSELVVVNGVATFTNLAIFGVTTPSGSAATTYKLRFFTETFQSVETDGIVLRHAAPARLTVESRPTSIAAGVASGDFVLAIRDQFGNPITDWSRAGAPWASDTAPAIQAIAGSGVVGKSGAVLTSSARAGFATISAVVIQRTATTSAPISFSYIVGPYSLSVSTTVNVIGGNPTQLSISQQVPPTIVAGKAFASAPVVKVLDAWNNDTTASATISATVVLIDGSSATRSETLTVSAVAGRANFVALTTSASAGVNYQLEFSLQGSNAKLLSGFFDILPADPHSFAFATGGNIATGESGIALKGLNGNGIVLEIVDAFGNKVTSDNSTTLIANVSSGSPITSLNSRTVRAANGIVTFNNLTLNAAARAGYVISFTASNAGTPIHAKVVAGNAFNLLAGTAAQLSLSTQSATVRSGKSFGQYPALSILDGEGSLINSGPNATLSATVSISHVAGGTGSLPSLSGAVTKEAAAGVADFTGTNLQLTGPVGFYVLTYTIENSNGTKISTTETVELLAGDPTDIRFVSSAPIRIQAGKTFNPVPVTELVDANGNRVRSDSSSKVVLQLVNSANVVVVSTSPVTAENGVASFPNVSFSATVGDYKLRAVIVEIDGGVSAPGVNQDDETGTFPLVHGDPKRFELVGNPSTTSYVVGSTYSNITVRVLDAFGNETNTDSSTDLTLSVSPVSGATYQRQSGARVSVVNGQGTFSNYVMIARPGDYEISVAASWMNQSLTPITSTFSVTVVHAAPAQLSVVRQAAGIKSRLAFETMPSVEIRDQYGNLATTATGTVIMQVSGGGPAQFSSSPSATIVGGLATFSNVALYGVADDYVLTYRMTTANGDLTATQQIELEAGNPHALAMKTQPAALTRAGDLMARQPVVRVLDMDQNPVTWDSSTTVSITVSAHVTTPVGEFMGSTGLVPVAQASALDVRVVNGEASFSTLRFKGVLAHSYSLVVSATGLTSVVTAEFRVSPGSLGGMVRTSDPVGGVNGESLGGSANGSNFPVLQLRDSFGNNITSDSNTVVTARIASGNNGSLAGSVSATAVNGVVSFENLRLSGLVSESYTLEFVSGAVVISSNAVSLTPAAPSQLSIVSLNTAGSAGVGFVPVELQVRDFSGNLVTAPGVVSAVVSGGGSVGVTQTAIVGTLSPTVAVSGRSGTYTVTYRVTYGSNVLSATHDITLSFGAPTQIGIVTQPAVTGMQTGAAFTPQPIVELRDQFGNRVPTAGITISAILHNPSSSQAIQKAVRFGDAVGNWTESSQAVMSRLEAPIAVTDANGTASFSDLAVIGLPGYSYQLRFEATGYSSIPTRNFVLSTANASELFLTAPMNTSVVAGTGSLGSYQVALRDRFMNVISASGQVQMRIKVDANNANVGRGGVLIAPAGQTLTASLSEGIAVFADYKLGGLVGVDYRFQFVSQALGLISTDSAAVNVTAGAATRFEFSQSPTLVSVGQNFAVDQLPVLRLVDQYGNLVQTQSGGTFGITVSPEVTLTTSTPQMTGGVFDPGAISMLGTPGVDYFMTITSNLPGISPVTTPAFRVLAGAPASIEVTQNPVGGVTGQNLASQPAIRILDAAGNPANLSSPINFNVELLIGATVIQAGGATSPYLRVAGSSYVTSTSTLQFDDIKVAGSTATNFALRITATNNQALSETTPTFRLSNDVAASMLITTDVVANDNDISSATRAVLGSQPRLELYDAFGNLAENDSSTRIIASLIGNAGTLSGQVIATARNGVVNFSGLAVQGALANGYSLQFREASASEIDFFVNGDSSAVPVAINGSGIALANSKTFRLNPGPAASIQVQVGLANRQVSGVASATQPTLRAFDQDGNIASTSQNLEATATVAGANGVLSGTNTATFVSGVAVFNNLALAGLPGESYTISYAVGGIPVVTQAPVFVNLLPALTLSYPDTVYAPSGTLSATVVSQSNAAFSFSVAESSAAVCSVNASTGEIAVLGAGTCLVNLSQSLSSVVVDGETRGAWLAKSTQASFQIAKANQARVTSAVSGSSTISQAAGSAFSEVFQVTVPFGTPVELAFGGGTVTSSALTYVFTTSPALAADNQLIQPCIRVADTVFAGNVQRTSIGAVAACRVLVTKLGDANYNSVTTALDIVVVPTNQAALNMVSNPQVEFNSSQRLFASGGNGTGAVGFRLVSGATVCQIDDSVPNAPRVLGIDSGTCEISATKASSNNFLAAQSQTQTFTVARAQQFLRFTSTIPQAPKVFGSAGALAVNFEYTPRAVASSNLPAVLSVLAETDSSGSAIVSACEYDGTKVTFIAPGRCVLVATQAGSSRYLEAQSISQVIEVGRLNQTINFDVVEDREFGDTAFQITASSNAGLEVRFTQAVGFSTLSCTVTPEGLVTLGEAGVCEIFAQQPGNATYLQAPPVKQRFMVDPKPAAKPFVTSVASADQAVLLSFREPSFRGGSPITAYEVIATKVADTTSQVISYGCLPLPVQAQQFDASGSPIVQVQGEVSCRIDGLENESQYILTVAAITAYGAGEVSTPTAPVTPAPNYSAPQQLSAISDNRFATLNWSTPLEIQGTFSNFAIYVRSVGTSEFTQLPSVASFSATSSAIPLDLLPPPAIPVVPTASPSVSETVSATVSSMVQSPVAFRSMFMSMPRNNMFAPMLQSAPVVQRAALFSVPSPSELAARQQGTNYEFMIITITDQVSTSNSINTARVQQQLLTAPAAPSTISAEPTGRDMFIAWGGSVFDGGSNIIDYVVTVNGQTVATSATPSSTIFANWQYSTTYRVEVKARNSIGLSPARSFTLTTPEDPTPPVVITESSEVREMILRLPQMISFNPKIAQPGSVVTVAGEKLDKLKTVKLGSRNVEFVVFGPNRLDIKVPMDMPAGLYPVEHFSEWGRVVVQDALTVAGSPVNEDLPPVNPGTSDSPAVDPDDIDGDGTNTNEDSDIDGDGSVNGSDSDIDGDTINNGRDPNPVVPNDPSEALPGAGENTGNEESTDSETANPGTSGGLLETNPMAAWILILIIALAGAIGAAPAIARARRKKREEELELQ